MEVPPALIKKWQKIFRYRDRNNDGILKESEFKRYAENFVTIYGERANPCRQIASLLWETQVGMGYKAEVTEEEFLKSYVYLWHHNKDKLKNNIEKYANICFDAIDVNGDGVISLEEYSIYQTGFGIHNRDYVEYVFSKLDRNGDGQLSRCEFVGDIMEFVFSELPERVPELYDHNLANSFRLKGTL